MSKIGTQPIKISPNIGIDIKDNTINVKSGNQVLSYKIPRNLEITQENGQLLVKRLKENKKTKSMHGFFRNLVNNAVVGLEKPWEKKLEVVGTGYNVKMQGEDLVFKVGYSHTVLFKHLTGLKYSVEGSTKVTVSGADKQFVGQTAHQIKLIKQPDAYKGKGIRYAGQQLKLKPGKKAKVGATAT